MDLLVSLGPESVVQQDTLNIAVENGKVLVLEVNGYELSDALSQTVDSEPLGLDQLELDLTLEIVGYLLPLVRPTDLVEV